GNTATASADQAYTVELVAPAITISINAIPTVNGAEAASSTPINVTGTVSSNVPVGDKVTLTVDGQPYTGFVLANHTYSIGVPGNVLAGAAADSIHAVVSMVDAAGNTATASADQPYTVELVAPAITISINAIPTVNGADAASANPISVTGTVSNNVPVGDKVTLTVDGQPYTGFVLANHTYSIGVPGNVLAGAATDSIHAVVSMVDAAGNTATASADQPYTVELVAPAITISINAIPIVNGAEAASSTPINVTGTVSSNVPVGDKVTLTVDGQPYTGFVLANHTYSIGVPGNVLAGAATDSIHAVVSMVDAAGNTATASADQPYTVELVAPAITISINAIPTVNGAEAASSTPINVTGTVSSNVPVGDKVTLTVDGQPYTGFVLANHTYSIGVPGNVLAGAAADSIHAAVSMVDAAGNTATASADQPYTVELVAPAITIGINAIPTVNGAAAASANPINVTGTVSSNVPVGDKVTLTVDGQPYTGFVLANHTYSIGVPGNVLAGAATDSIHATVSMVDAAGNTATASADQPYTVELVAPAITIGINAIPTLNIAEASSSTAISITGTVSSNVPVGDIVTLTVDGHNYTGNVQTGGTYSIGIPGNVLAAASSDSITAQVSMTDAAGNIANASANVAYSVDLTTPPTPAVGFVEANSNGLISSTDLTTPGTVNATVTLNSAGQSTLANGGTLQITINDNNVIQHLTLSINAGGNLVDASNQVYSYSGGVITLPETAPGNANTISITANEIDVNGNPSYSATSTAVEYTPASTPAVTIVGAVNGELSTATTGASVNATIALDAQGQATLLSNGTVQITVTDAGVTQNLNLHLNASGALVDGSGTTYNYSGGVITLSESAPGSGNTITVSATETDAAAVVSASSMATASEYTPAPSVAPAVAIVGAISSSLTNSILGGATTVDATITLNAVQQSVLTSGGSVHLTIVDAGLTQTVNLAYNGSALVDSLGHTYSYTGGVITITEPAPGTGNAISVSALLTDAGGHSTPAASASATETITLPDTPTVALLANGLIGNYYGITESQISSPPSGYSALGEVDAYLLTKGLATSTIAPTSFPGAVIAPATATFTATEINYGLNTTSTSPGTGNETITNNLGVTGNLAKWLNVTGTSGPYATNFQTLAGYGTTNQAIITMTGAIALPTLKANQQYALKIFADDGYQIYVDGNLVATVPANQSGKADYFYFTAPATAGNLHSVQILYWDQGGQASMQASIGTINTANVPANSTTVPTLATPLSILTPAQAGEVTATVTLDSKNQTILSNGGTILVTESNGTNLTLHQNSTGHMVDASGLVYTYVNGVVYIPVSTSSSTASISATVVDQYTYASSTAFTGPAIAITSDSNHDGYLNAKEVTTETVSGHFAANVNLNTAMLAGGGSAIITVVDAGVTTTLAVSSAGVITGTTANVAATYSAGLVTLSIANPGNGNSATISATQTDQYGHVSTTATSTVVENINAAPAAPVVAITTDTNHDGYLSAPELNGNAIVNATITLNSAAQTTLTNGGTVQIYVADNGTTETLNLHLNSSGVLVNAAGASSSEYSYANGVIALTESAPGNGQSITVSATTTDIAGNVSALLATASAIQDALDSPTVMLTGPHHGTVVLGAADQTVLATTGSTLTVTASDGTNLTLHQNSSGQLVDASNGIHSYANGILPLTLNTNAAVVNMTATLTDSHGVNSYASSATLVNSGSNSLTELAGGDTFIFALGANGTPGTPHVETISAFNSNAASNGGDVLNLADLLTGVTSSTTATALANYLHFTEVSNGSGGYTTTVHVNSGGGFPAGQDTLQIVLANADLLHSAGVLQTDAQIIQTLLNHHKLVD
ncbi:hypothetical protein AAKU67_003627, partial [Oxalobacteraceae bacterium GrIS 2.11]